MALSVQIQCKGCAPTTPKHEGKVKLINKDERLEIRLSKQEKEKIKQMAAKAGMKTSPYIRKVALGVVPKEKPPIEYHQMINQLNQISTALNEIAMVAKRTGHIEAAKYAQIVQLVQNILLKIMAEVTLPDKR